MDYTSLNALNTASSQKIVIMRIKRIIEKYSEVWRVLHEPIQNSIDAIQRCSEIDGGNVNVHIHLANEHVVIEDDGKGFPQDLDLLLPDGTDKSEQDGTMGYQGVGLKSVIYSSQSFKLLSHLENDTNWGISIENGSEYLVSNGTIEAPISIPKQKRITRGTTIEIKFNPGVVIRAIEQIIEAVTTSESNFRWNWERGEVKRSNVRLKKAKNNVDVFKYMLEYYMCTHTYVGSVSRLLNSRLEPSRDLSAKPVNVKINIDFTNINPDTTSDDFLKSVIDDIHKQSSHKLDINVENKFMDFQAIVAKQKSRNVAFDILDFDIRKAGIQKNPTLKDQVYCKIMTPDYTKSEENFERRYAQYISLLNGTSEQRKEKNLRRFRDLFPKVLGIYILIGRLEYFERFIGNNYGIKIIAANGVPTHHELTPRSSNQSFYFNPITFILNVDGKLNEGKTHLIDDSLKRKCVLFFREAFESTLNRLTKEFVQTVRKEKRPTPDSQVTSRNIISIPHIDIKREPEDENTLIALFYQLLQIQKLQLPTYGLFSQGIYDGKFVYEDDGILSDNDLLSLEFKVLLQDLLYDFDDPNSSKQFSNCDLLIVWNDTMRTIQQQDWRVVNREAAPTSALAESNIPDWIDTLLRDANHIYRPIIIVKDWVAELDANTRDRT